MKIKQVRYYYQHHLDSSHTEEVTLIAEVEADETYSQVLEKLREESRDSRGLSWWDVRDKISRAEEVLKGLEIRIADRSRQWNELAEFLKAQGIKEDAPNFPLLPALPPQAIEGEILDDDDEDDEYDDED